jgi:RNA polymerase sigma-70 factor (ECF subfamily)
VQDTLLKAFNRLNQFEYRGEGKFLAYLRQILLNEIRLEVRIKSRRPGGEPLHDGHRDTGKTPGHTVEGWETIERYERALADLNEEQRIAVVLRIEYAFSYEEIAKELQRPSANAARMVVARALARLAKLMRNPDYRGNGKDGSGA